MNGRDRRAVTDIETENAATMIPALAPAFSPKLNNPKPLTHLVHLEASTAG